MDVKQVGRFLAELRTGMGLTQERLGQELGVSNKTVSRWENGNYLPPVEMLECLSKLYGITINEILSGQRLSQDAFQAQAEENLKSALDSSGFSLKERMEYFKSKWRKEHRASGVLGLLGFVGCYVYALGVGRRTPELPFLVWVALIAMLILRHNAMMAYVEGRVFDQPDTTLAREDSRRKQDHQIRRWRIGGMILLGISLVITMDLGYNYLTSQVPELNDGLTVRGIFSRWAFGGEAWTRVRFLRGFLGSAWVSVALAVGNLALACWEKLRKP